MIQLQPLRLIYRACLGAAYLLLIFEWLWVLLLVVPPLIETGVFESLSTPKDTAPLVESGAVNIPPVGYVLIGLFTLLLLIATVVILLRIPKAIAQTSDKIIHQASDLLVPTVSHHAPLSKKKKRILSDRISFALQISTAILPVIICPFLPESGELTRQIIIAVTLFMAGLSLALFIAAQGIRNLRTRKQTRRKSAA